MATVLSLRTAWIVDIFLSQAPLRDVQRQRCWKCGSGDGQRLWDYGTTERSFNAVSALCASVERRGSTFMRTVFKIGGNQIVKSGKFGVCAYSRTALNCRKKTILCFLPSLSIPRPLFKRGWGGGEGEI